MMGQCRTPRVEHHGHADAGTQVTRITSDCIKRFCGGLEQQTVDLGLVLIGDIADRCRQGKDNVVVLHGQ